MKNDCTHTYHAARLTVSRRERGKCSRATCTQTIKTDYTNGSSRPSYLRDEPVRPRRCIHNACTCTRVYTPRRDEISELYYSRKFLPFFLRFLYPLVTLTLSLSRRPFRRYKRTRKPRFNTSLYAAPIDVAAERLFVVIVRIFRGIIILFFIFFVNLFPLTPMWAVSVLAYTKSLATVFR